MFGNEDRRRVNTKWSWQVTTKKISSVSKDGWGRGLPPAAAAQVKKNEGGYWVPASRLNKPTVWCTQDWVTLGHQYQGNYKTQGSHAASGLTCQGVYPGPGTSSTARSGAQKAVLWLEPWRVRYRWIKDPSGPNWGEGEHAQELTE